MLNNTEQWKEIQGYESLYQISNTGKIKSLGRIYFRGRKYNQKIILKEKFLKQRVDSRGYP